MQAQKEYVVQLVVTQAHEYILTARTEEEAVSIAEGMYEDGDQGKLLGAPDIEQADAYPYQDEEDGEEED